MEKYSLIVGNIGEVHRGDDTSEAYLVFNHYVMQSRQNLGSAGNEPVTLFTHGEIEKEFNPLNDLENPTNFKAVRELDLALIRVNGQHYLCGLRHRIMLAQGSDVRGFEGCPVIEVTEEIENAAKAEWNGPIESEPGFPGWAVVLSYLSKHQSEFVK